MPIASIFPYLWFLNNKKFLHYHFVLFNDFIVVGNSWGCSEDDCCIGCGEQEQFFNCADIGISDAETKHVEPVSRNTLSSLHDINLIETRMMKCKPSPVYTNVPGMTEWCQDVCPFCPQSHCICYYGRNP